MGFNDDKNTSSSMKTVFLSGSRRITRLNSQTQKRLENIIHKGMGVVVGDAHGADKAMQTFFAEKEYPNVEVFFAGSTCRNNLGYWAAEQIIVDPNLKGRAIHTEKDKAMAVRAAHGFVLWDGKSAGSITNVCELLRQGKNSLVYLSPLERFFDVKSVANLKELLKSCDPNDVRELENSPILKQQLSILDISTQQRFDL